MLTQKMQQQLCEYFNCRAEQLEVYGRDQWGAPVASGSSVADAMVICPCSMGSLAAIAQGISNNLIHRAADVVIKERRPLVLVPRETPFSSLHLENMLRLSNLGVIILPPNPGFYQGVSSVQDLVDYAVLQGVVCGDRDRICERHLGRHCLRVRRFGNRRDGQADKGGAHDCHQAFH